MAYEQRGERDYGAGGGGGGGRGGGGGGDGGGGGGYEAGGFGRGRGRREFQAILNLTIYIPSFQFLIHTPNLHAGTLCSWLHTCLPRGHRVLLQTHVHSLFQVLHYNEHPTKQYNTGPVTDYGATMVHWMQNRQPRYKARLQGEMERPSPSYIVDVSTPCINNLCLYT